MQSHHQQHLVAIHRPRSQWMIRDPPFRIILETLDKSRRLRPGSVEARKSFIQTRAPAPWQGLFGTFDPPCPVERPSPNNCLNLSILMRTIGPPPRHQSREQVLFRHGKMLDTPQNRPAARLRCASRLSLVNSTQSLAQFVAPRRQCVENFPFLCFSHANCSLLDATMGFHGFLNERENCFPWRSEMP